MKKLFSLVGGFLTAFGSCMLLAAVVANVLLACFLALNSSLSVLIGLFSPQSGYAPRCGV
jgi:hypothetical protein